MDNSTFRIAALALPEAGEQDHFGAPSFRVRGKIFAQLSADGLTGSVKLPLDRQAWLLEALPGACAAEPQWGRYGWTRLTWRAIDPDLIVELLAASWRAVAPGDLRRSHCDIGGV